MQKFLIITGIVLIIVGIAWPFIKKLGLGHLPGDIIVQKENFAFYFPIVTCVIISIVISLILWLINR